MHKTILKARSSESVESDGQEKCYLFVIDVRRRFFIAITLILHWCIIIDTFKCTTNSVTALAQDAHKLPNNFHYNNFIIYNIHEFNS